MIQKYKYAGVMNIPKHYTLYELFSSVLQTLKSVTYHPFPNLPLLNHQHEVVCNCNNLSYNNGIKDRKDGTDGQKRRNWLPILLQCP